MTKKNLLKKETIRERFVASAKNVNEKYIYWGLAFMSVLGILAVTIFGAAKLSAIAGIVVAQVQAAAVYLLILFGLVFFLGGTDFDLQREIFVEHNRAAATLIAGIAIGLAMVISKAIL